MTTGLHRAETDASLQTERQDADDELARRFLVADDDADELLRVARARADRVLAIARTAADARLPLSEQTEAALRLLLEQRDEEDRTVAAERDEADELLHREKLARRERLSALLEVDRQTTDLRLELERKSADKAVASRDEFRAQASHDVRALMGAQKIYLSLLVKQLDAREHGSELAGYAAALLKIDAQMDRLIGDLVDLVAIEAGKLAVTLGPASAAELVSTATAFFEPVARERQQSLFVAPTPADVSVLADTPRAIQVLGNLLSNAIKFTPPNGKIHLGFEANQQEVMFFVADTGPGIPAEQAQHIFERFVGSSSARNGLGLGLFIAARIIDAHGGRIWFDPDRAAGSVFRFTLSRTE